MNLPNFPKIIVISISLFFFANSFSQNKYNTQNAKAKTTSILKLNDTEENDEKILELGNNIQNAIFNSNPEEYMALFDYDSFGNFITSGIKEDGDTKAFKTGFLNGLKGGIKSVPNKIISEVDAGGYYDFVNYSYDDVTQTYYLLFRIYSSEAGINYHNYRVSKVNGKFTFNDLYIYLSGEELSKTFRRFYIYNLPKKSLFDFFGEGNSKEFIKVVDAVNYNNQGQFEKAYNKFNEIEGDLKNDKFILVIKTVCAAKVSDEEYKKAMKNIAEKFPDDSTLYLSQIDYHVMNKNYDKALSLIDKLMNDTSDDFLNLLKGNIEFEKSNYNKALEHFKFISDNYPDLFEGHSSYLTILSLTGNFEKCVKLLSFLVDDGYEKSVIIEFVEEKDENGENNLIELVNSDAYNKWKKI